MPFDVQSLEPLIREILTADGVDLSTISAKRVRKQLVDRDESLAEDLKEHKKEVDLLIGSVFESINNDETKPSKREREDSSAEGEDEEDEGSAKRAKKRREEADAELAQKLSSEINGRSSRRSSKSNGGAQKKPARKGKKKSAETVDSDGAASDGEGAPKKKAKGGFAKEYALSEPLADVLGVDTPLSRPQVVKQLWAYIKSNGLQNPDNGKEILCDDKLRAVFSTDKLDMFKMNKLLGQHLSG